MMNLFKMLYGLIWARNGQIWVDIDQIASASWSPALEEGFTAGGKDQLVDINMTILHSIVKERGINAGNLADPL